MAARRVARIAKRRLTAKAGGDPIALPEVVRLRDKLGGTNVLAPTFREARSSPSALDDPELARLLEGRELGTWAIGPETIALIGDLIATHRPGIVLELGSGISTLCLAHFMQRAHGDASFSIISIEQSEEMTAGTEELLGSAGLASAARVVTKELVEMEILGRQTLCYDLADLDRILPGTPGLVLIDGPSGPPGVRFATLPLVAPHLRPGTRFLLDDALRDDELDIATEWSTKLDVHIEGIHLFETGVLVGSLGPSS